MTRFTRSWAVVVALTAGIAVVAGGIVRAEYAPESQIAVPSVPAASAVLTPGPAASAGRTPDPTPTLAPTPAATPTTILAPTPTPAIPPPKSPSPSPTHPASVKAASGRATPTPTKSASPAVRAPEPFDPATLTPVPRTVPQVTPLPDRSLHIADRYRRNATRVGWDTVVNSGRSLPGISASCARSWRKSGRDSRIDWSSARYLCLNALPGLGPSFRPQGVGGSATTEGYWIGNQPAADRNLILTSWYSTARGGSKTRLVVMDMDKRRYNSVELVRPSGSRGLRNIDSHGSGLVWAGQYIYSSSKSELWMYNADDILKINGRYVLPAVARWTVHGTGGLSSISIDRSTNPNRLRSINYSKAGHAYIQSFDLAETGLLAANSGGAAQDLALTNSFGQRGPAVHSASSMVISGGSFQGVASVGAYGFANSSSMRVNGRKGDAAVVLKGGKVVGRFRMPHGNGQSIYIDYRRGNYVSVTERGSQFMFELPLQHLTKAR